MSKKLLAIILVISMFISCNPFVYALGTDYLQTDPVTLSISQNTISVETNIAFNNAKLVLVSYDNNMLIDIKILYFSAWADTETQISIPQDLKKVAKYKIKAMLWENTEDIMPLATYTELACTTITYRQLESVSYNAYDNYVLVKYRENPEDRLVQSYKLDFDPTANPESLTKVYINGVLQDISEGYDIVKDIGKTGDVIGKGFNGNDIKLNHDAFYGDIVLSENDAEYDYNTVFVTDYRTVVVDEVTATKIVGHNDCDLIFERSDGTVDATLYDAKGNRMNWTDLKEYDVVTFTQTKNTSTTVINGWLVDKAITGTVSTITNEDERVFTINNSQYRAAPTFDPNEIAIGDTGTFYLDMLGNIVYVQKAASENYAYVMDLSCSGLESPIQMKLLTKDGTVKLYDLDSIVNIDGIQLAADSMKNEDGSLKDAVVNLKTGIDYLRNTHGSEYYIFDYSSYDPIILAVKKLTTDQLITFKENAEGKITSIDRAFSINNYDSANKFTKYKTEYASSIYDDATKTLSAGTSRLFITDDTVVMVAPAGETDDKFTIIDLSILKGNYLLQNVTFYNVNDDQEIGAVVIKNPNFTLIPNSGDPGTDPGSFIIANAIPGLTINSEGYTVDLIKGLKDGASLPEDLLTTPVTDVNIAIGDVFRPELNEKGEVKAIYLLASADINNDVVNVSQSVIDKNADETGNEFYYFGKIYDINRNLITLADPVRIGSYSVSDFAISSNANIYIYDERQINSRKVMAGGCLSNYEVDSYNYEPEYYDCDDFREISNMEIFAREFGGEIKDVVIYIFD